MNKMNKISIWNYYKSGAKKKMRKNEKKENGREKKLKCEEEI